MNREANDGFRPDPLTDFSNEAPDLPGAENRIPWRIIAATTLLGTLGGGASGSAKGADVARVLQEARRNPPMVQAVEPPLATLPIASTPDCNIPNIGMPYRDTSGDLRICTADGWKEAKSNIRGNTLYSDQYGPMKLSPELPDGLAYPEGLNGKIVDKQFDPATGRWMYRVEVSGPDGMGVYFAESEPRPIR
jgi:hypothetical protein